MSEHTSWRDERAGVQLAIFLHRLQQVLIPLPVRLKDRLSSLVHRIFVVERDLEGRLRGLVSWCFGVEAFQAGVERLASRARLQIANHIFLIVRGEYIHDGCLHRASCGMVRVLLTVVQAMGRLFTLVAMLRSAFLFCRLADPLRLPIGLAAAGQCSHLTEPPSSNTCTLLHHQDLYFAALSHPRSLHPTARSTQ